MLTELQRQKLARYFRVYDVNDDGRVAPGDFERIVENIRILHGLRPGSAMHNSIRDAFMAQWDALRRSADADADGAVSEAEWFGYWSALIGSDTRYEEEVAGVVTRVFELFDTDRDGLIGADEFCDFYAVFGMRSAVARQVFLDIDLDGDGVISQDQLAEIADQFFRGNDPAAPGNRLFGPL